VADYDRLVWAYDVEPDTTRRQQLAVAYQRLTGQDVQRRLASLKD
jgi:hypothetical protein